MMSVQAEEVKERIKNDGVRASFVALSVFFQILWFIWMGLHVGQYNHALNGVITVVSWVLALHVYSRYMNSAYKLSWIILILFMPVLGISMYIMFGSQMSHVWIRKHPKTHAITSRGFLPENYSVQERLKTEDLAMANQTRYIQRTVGYPVYQNTDVVYHNDTSIALEDIKAELRKAKDFIFMEYHAIEDSVSWAGIEEVLTEKAAAGVDVRVLYDDVGSIFYISTPFARRLQSKGIQCRAFNRISPLLNGFMNNRDHRKITVVDGVVGFTGGYNLADRYFNIDSPYGYWKDTGLKLTGDAVKSLTAIFLEMWNTTQKQKEDQKRYFPVIAYRAKEDGYVQPYSDTPLDYEKVGENVYLNLIKNAKRYVYITTPYLLIDDEMHSELTLAAQRGVDVRIVTPGIPDKKLVYRATRSYYARLIACGVRIYEYTPGFMHAKQFVSDDEVAIVGTINLDFRSLYLHFENGCWFYNCKAVHDVKADFEHLFKVSEEVTGRYKGKRSLTLRLGECILRLLSPMM